MESGGNTISFEEVLDTEIDDIWDIFFPYMMEKREKITKPQKRSVKEHSKPRRYLQFLVM